MTCASALREIMVAAAWSAAWMAGTPQEEARAPNLAPRERALPVQLQMTEVASARGMVVTASGPASWAGARMLEEGGNAIDAAVAAALALTVTEPGSSGIGGQTYILIRLAGGRCLAIDGSVRAPLHAAIDEMSRIRLAQMAVNPGKSFYGYRAVATPGTLAALDLALRRYGTKTFAEAVAPAIEIADRGTSWTLAQHAFMVYYNTKVRESPYLRALFLKDGIETWDPAHVYCNPDLACFLRRLAAVGPEDFYHGAIAREIDRDMEASGGWLRLGDLGLMRPEEREPVRGRYRGLEVLSFPSPGGGATVVEALGILGCYPQRLLREDTPDRLHLLLEACRLAYADSFPLRRPPRAPDDLAQDPGYVARRASLIRFDRALRADEISTDPLSTLSAEGTSEVSVADAAGNAVALTQTLGATFGSGVATAGFGFAYNSLMNCFEFDDRSAWARLAPLARPLTSMAPTIVVGDGRPLLVLGSAGSSRIASLIVDTLVAFIDRQRPPCEAIAAPHVLWEGAGPSRTAYLELVDPITEAQADELAARGFARQDRLTYPASALDLTEYGGVNAVFIDPVDGMMVGVGDPRRQGVAIAPRERPLPDEDATPATECSPAAAMAQ